VGHWRQCWEIGLIDLSLLIIGGILWWNVHLIIWFARWLYLWPSCLCLVGHWFGRCAAFYGAWCFTCGALLVLSGGRCFGFLIWEFWHTLIVYELWIQKN
jgi:hypothetical protein